MKNEVAIAVPLIILPALLLNQWVCNHHWMEATVIGLLVLFAALFIGLIWKERVKDERESLHRHISSRFAYLASVAVLTLGIIFQTVKENLDPWLVAVICIMILGKLFGLIYSRIKH